MSSIFKKYFPGVDDIVNFSFVQNPKFQYIDQLVCPESLSHDMADLYITKLKYDDKEYIINRALDQNIVKILSLKTFQEILHRWTIDNEYEKIEHGFEMFLSNYSLNNKRKNDTERKYWLIYLLVESLILDKSSNINKACKLIAEELDGNSESMRRRHHQMATKIKNEKISIVDIRNRYGWIDKNFSDLILEYF